MNTDFKYNILKWLTGNYEVGSGNNVPQFSNVENKTNNFDTQFNTLFPNGYFIRGILQGQDNNNNGVGFSIIYGVYYIDNTYTTMKGFIVILDEDFDIIQSITSYASGTQFGIIEIMGVGDDGNFFLIENNSGTKRFVLLNNIIAKLSTEQNYKVILRQSYNLSGQSTNIETFTQLIKAPSQSKYLIVGNDSSQHVIATELTINVGTSNDWVDYKYTANMFTIGDAYASWDSQGNLIFKLSGFKMTNYVNLTYGELSANSTQGQTLTLSTYGSEFTNAMQYNVRKINLTQAYYTITYIDPNSYDYAYMKMFYFNNGTLTELKSIHTTAEKNIGIKLFKVGEETFYIYDYSYPINTNWTMRVGKLINNQFFEKTVGTFNSHPYSIMYMVQKQFNLYNYFIQIGNVVYNIKQIYNYLNYNGVPYQDLNSMVPNSAILKSNGVEIFARNLYNRVINNNTTVSTLNVPNNFINDIEIDNEILYGLTKKELVNATGTYTTNIFEELMINFVNALMIINENDPTNAKENLIGASRLNNSISLTTDYSSAMGTKIKINYTDNTSSIQNITWIPMKNYYTTQIIINVEKEIDNIQIISNDENTVYQTIEDIFEVGKTYSIRQDVWIIDKPAEEPINYNNQPVYFNNEPVYY